MNENEVISNNEEITEVDTDKDIPETPEAAEEEADAPAEGSDILALKNEIAELKAQLDDSRGVYDKLSADCSEFAELYPDVALSSIPDSVWSSVKNGIPLAAAYALAERRAALALEKADGINSKNKALSTGTMGRSKSEEYFSPAEVKAMSASEVRANYTKIINSMSKWH